MRTKTLAHTALLIALGLLAPIVASTASASAPADPALVWEYEDPAGDQRRPVDVVRTQLDLNVEGQYRIRVFGRDFIKNKTDIVRINFDTDGSDSWPEYQFSWYLGKNPARPVQRTSLYRVEYWRHGSRTKLRCPGMGHQVNYAKDVITVSVARTCLKNPERLRWAGFVALIYGVTEEGRFYSHQDQFPAENEFLDEWVG